MLSDVTSPQTVFELLRHLLPTAPRSPRTGLCLPPPLKAGRCPRWCLPPPPRLPPGRRRRRRPPAPRPDPNGPRRRPGSSLRRWRRSTWRKSWTSSSPPAPRRRRVRVPVCRGRPLPAARFFCVIARGMNYCCFEFQRWVFFSAPSGILKQFVVPWWKYLLS